MSITSLNQHADLAEDAEADPSVFCCAMALSNCSPTPSVKNSRNICRTTLRALSMLVGLPLCATAITSVVATATRSGAKAVLRGSDRKLSGIYSACLKKWYNLPSLRYYDFRRNNKMGGNTKIGLQSSAASEIHANQKASLKEHLSNPKQIWGKSVRVVKDFFTIKPEIATTLKHFANMLSHQLRSDVERTMEGCRAVKAALRGKNPNKLNKENLRSKNSIDKWMSGSDRYTPDVRETLHQRLGGQVSLRELVAKEPLTRAVIRDRNISSEEALVIHALLNDNAKSVKGAEIIEVLGNGLSKLPDQTGDCYFAVRSSVPFNLDLGGTYTMANNKVVTENKIYPDPQEPLDIYIVKSNRGKSIREFSDANLMRNVIYPPGTQFTVSQIKQNQDDTRTVILIDADPLTDQNLTK